MKGTSRSKKAASSPAVTQASGAGARQDTDRHRPVETTDFGVDKRLILCPAVALSLPEVLSDDGCMPGRNGVGRTSSEYRVGRLHRGPPRPNISCAQNRPSVIDSNPKG